MIEISGLPSCREWQCGCHGHPDFVLLIRMEDDLRFRVLRLLSRNPEMTQREIAQELGIALGRVNFLLHALIGKGLIKARNFRNSRNKLRYAYVLTPQGLSTKAQLTGDFLRRKTEEYDALHREIEALRAEMTGQDTAEGAHR